MQGNTIDGIGYILGQEINHIKWVWCSLQFLEEEIYHTLRKEQIFADSHKFTNYFSQIIRHCDLNFQKIVHTSNIYCIYVKFTDRADVHVFYYIRKKKKFVNISFGELRDVLQRNQLFLLENTQHQWYLNKSNLNSWDFQEDEGLLGWINIAQEFIPLYHIHFFPNSKINFQIPYNSYDLSSLYQKFEKIVPIQVFFPIPTENQEIISYKEYMISINFSFVREKYLELHGTWQNFPKAHEIE